MTDSTMRSTQEPPVFLLVGAPSTGVRTLALALQDRLDPAQVCIAVDFLPGQSPSQADLSSTPFATPTGCVARLRPATLTLLMGLDLPCPAGERAAQEAADAQLRAALQSADAAYQVVYGQGEARLHNALSAIKKIAGCAFLVSATASFDTETPLPEKLQRTWECEKCSDPACEFRLFSRLTGGRLHSAA